ncbi:MAG TPA: ABC transporter permease, partial [Bryobacteraceae bacterium]|nr:ABC transporter permease [Bryobacteraceae bacterium]
GASRRFRLGRSLAAAQIGVSFILVLAAGLFVGTLRNLMNTDLGFKADGVMLVNVDARRAAKNGNERVTLHRDVLHRLRKLPGVASVSASGLVPLGRNTWNEWIASDGYGGAPGPDALLYMNAVSPGYFQTMGTRFIAGRDLNEFDGATSTPVMILNESAARRFFGATTAIGRTVRIGNAANGVRFQVIGVVQDAKYERVQEKAPIAGFLPLQVVPAPTYTYELRHTGPASVLTPVVRSTIAAVSRDIGIEFQSLSTHVDASVQQQRVLAALSVLFGGLALLLSMVGLYGVTAYSVAQRRAEIGLRMALGARTNSVLWLVLREAAVLLGSGIALGLAGALALGRLLATLLYELKPNDPAQILVAAAMLAGATALAAFLPAWSAARLDPMRALRDS